MMLKAAILSLSLTACLMPPAGSQSTTTPSSSSSASDPDPSPATSSSMSSSAPKAASVPAGPQTVSVTIRSSCGKTAKVFFGDNPGFSSGTQSSVSSNSVENKTFRVGDQMWVLDDSGKGLSNVTIGTGTRNIEIGSSCTAISAR
jgi:hypothetical protein